MEEVSTHHANKKFMFKLEAVDNPSILPIFSDSFFVVYKSLKQLIFRKYQLVLQDTVPSEWYKDEGGKRNHIALFLSLVVISIHLV